ncbi:MAG: heme lyase CcmF/NrfE family subunit [Phycisphaeraceae bacterium]|nr:heme lyase CcmF/NrfE family subunit [Phycisphaeraceae bacterium]
MTALTGDAVLSMALLVAAGTLLAAMLNVRAARWMLWAYTVLILGAGAVLLTALLQSNFKLIYVAQYTERALPTAYKMAAFWAGQQGSLLLWAILLAVMSAVAAVQWRGRSAREQTAALAVLAVTNGFFAALMLFVRDADPFTAYAVGKTPADGFGLNPLLQNPSMIAHPLLLFVGYAGFTVPFAMLAGALAGGERSDAWLVTARKWLLFSWLFLSVGILLGAQWAYVELGWGGYWAWDPVENASLLPWLTATAVLHSIGLQLQRGMFRRWNAALIGTSFILCILATYITRSGAIQSVHAFGDSLVGPVFLGFLLLSIITVVGLLAWRWQLLEPKHTLERLVGKEGAFLAVNVLLVLITIVTMYGTMHPVLAGLFKENPGSYGPEFYNHVVVPLGLLLVALMSVGPLLIIGSEAGKTLLQGMIIPGVLSVIAIGVTVVMGVHNVYALLCVALTVFTFVNVLRGLLKAAIDRMKLHDEGLALALLRALDGDHRRYGGQTVHLGMILIVVGVTGSSLFSDKQELSMKAGDSVQVAGFTVRYDGMEQLRHANFTAFDAAVTLTDAAGNSSVLHPQVRYYDKSEQPNSEVALLTNLKRDIYITLAGWEDNGKLAAIQIIVNPLLLWIWIGSVVLTLGGTLCLLPRLCPQRQADHVKVTLPVGLGSCQTPAMEQTS